MATTRSRFHKGYQLYANVEQYQSGPFVGTWYVLSQTCDYPVKGLQAAVAHQQNNGPCGSQEDAFKKAFSTLERFIDDDLARENALRGGDEVGNG